MDNTNHIYLDYASTTPVSNRVFKTMQPYFSEKYGNPSSLHLYGREAQNALDDARTTIADILNCDRKEITFTASATESINTIVHTSIHDGREKNIQHPHIITTQIEHSAVLETCRKEMNAEVDYIQPDENGFIDPAHVEKLLTKNTVLVSIGYANNEIGTIQPIQEIAEILKSHPAIFHTDATQAAGYCEIDTKKLGVDALTASSHKIYGPKGAGLLFLSKKYNLQPLLVGGEQENSSRAGTENIPAIVGFAEALSETEKTKDSEPKRQKDLRDTLIKDLLKHPKITLNGGQESRLPNNINISIEGIKNDVALAYLDRRGIYVSSGSACSSNTPSPSYVLTAINNPHPRNSLRITLGRPTKKQDIEEASQAIHQMIADLQ